MAGREPEVHVAGGASPGPPHRHPAVPVAGRAENLLQQTALQHLHQTRDGPGEAS